MHLRARRRTQRALDEQCDGPKAKVIIQGLYVVHQPHGCQKSKNNTIVLPLKTSSKLELGIFLRFLGLQRSQDVLGFFVALLILSRITSNFTRFAFPESWMLWIPLLEYRVAKPTRSSWLDPISDTLKVCGNCRWGKRVDAVRRIGQAQNWILALLVPPVFCNQVRFNFLSLRSRTVVLFSVWKCAMECETPYT